MIDQRLDPSISTSALHRIRSVGRFALALGIVIPLLLSSNAIAIDDLPQPGLIATYQDESGRAVERLDVGLAFDWSTDAPDVRLQVGKFKAKWTGQLLIRASGDYRFASESIGSVVIEIDDQVVLNAEADADKPSDLRWVAAEKQTLRAGLHDIVIRFEKKAARGAMHLYWSSDKFSWEPLNPANTLVDPYDMPDDSFTRGSSLVEAYRCSACHSHSALQTPLDAPSLDRLTGNLHPQWLVDRLMQEASHAASDQTSDQTSGSHQDSHSKMPHFAMARGDAQAVAAFLFDLSKGEIPKSLDKVKPPKPKRGETLESDPIKRGEVLFASLGCLSCHAMGELGSNDLLSGGSLESIADKRPERFFARWLRDPAAINRTHRMPQFALNASEASDLEDYLASQKSTQVIPPQDGASKPNGQQNVPSVATNDTLSWMTDAAMIQRGSQLFEQHRCAACHQVRVGDDAKQKQPRIALTAAARWGSSCLEPSQGQRPFVALDPADRLAVKDFFMQSFEPAKLESETVTESEANRWGGHALTGADVLRRSQCLACHRRQTASGNADIAMQVAAHFGDRVEHVAALTPPSLSSIGDKFKHASLLEAVQGKADRRRPWLRARMPKFRFNDGEAQQLADWFVDQDRVPRSSLTDTEGDAAATPLSKAALLAVGPRLVTSGGFGCASCHAIGDVSPAKAPIDSKGPNLAGLGKHIRKEWFDRWVADPLRIVPRVEMPAIRIPVGGVLNEDLPQQIDAVWHVLNLDGFRPPKPDPVRTVRHDGIAAETKAHVLTDLLRIEDRTLIKPFLIGLPNRHNVLFDLEQGTLAGWWTGDTASQYTEGKSWFWEAGGVNLMQMSSPLETFALYDTKTAERYLPQRVGQFITSVDRWHHIPDGLSFTYRLHFQVADKQQVVLEVTEQMTAIADAATTGETNRSGWRRTISVVGELDQFALMFPVVGDRFAVADDRTLRHRERPQLQVQLVFDPTSTVRQVDSFTASVDNIPSFSLTASQTVVLDYLADLPVDRFVQPSIEEQAAEPIALDVVPGIAATQLGLPSDILPIAMAWRDVRTMFVADLKGRVFRVVDTDGDKMPDHATQYSDELAAPFGLHAGPDYVDVITKFALLRLHDDPDGERAGRAETLVAGWGHTTDYHDWATGLPRDKDGRYFVAFACQQDDRSEAAAQYRGKVVELVPRQATTDNPYRFDIRLLSGGHRFPIGIARNRDGNLFVTDNQGNYNPYNELNHVMPGHRYGFLNKLERRDGFSPPLTAPAIDIPHPWTRSVNGICFLESPDGKQGFGPWEGHLVGCEYDTQRLIRMSLQNVDGTLQGAAYPLSYDAPPSGPPMLGPISCGVSPDGALFVGNIRESGWGAGQNMGNLVRLDFRQHRLPSGIAEVQATANGLTIRFTGTISPEHAADAKRYTIESSTRVATPAYGGDDQNRRSESIDAIQYDAATQTATIQLSQPLREGYVYDIGVESVCADPQATFFPSQAFYTMRKVPQ